MCGICAINIQNDYEIECKMTENAGNIFQIQRSAKRIDFQDIDKLYREKLTRLIVERANDDYLPWAEFRNKSWVPQESAEGLWHIIFSNRIFGRKATPIVDGQIGAYAFDPHRHTQFLHEIDLEFGGNMLGIKDFSEGDKRQIVRRNLIEESIASSKLEGANTSREAARRMLHEGRKPRDKSERMIVNNHQAMLQIEEKFKDSPMSLDTIFDLHRTVTSGTLDDPSHEGKLRDTFDVNGQRLKIMPWDETTVTYIAPDRDFVEAQLPRFIDFANDTDGSGFIHPLFKAIMLHFWIGLLHPFEDGNGRLARIMFYWYMLRKGYWAFAYLSLSERIQKSPKQYAMAYIYSEQDNYDLNYFIQYNVEKLQLARGELQDYLKQKIAENKRHNNLLLGENALNRRQFNLLQHLSKDEQRNTSVASYNKINPEIGYITAVSDLKALVEKGLLKKVKTGRNVNYFPTEKTAKLMR